jgi:hypothetical protein
VSASEGLGEQESQTSSEEGADENAENDEEDGVTGYVDVSAGRPSYAVVTAATRHAYETLNFIPQFYSDCDEALPSVR